MRVLFSRLGLSQIPWSWKKSNPHWENRGFVSAPVVIFSSMWVGPSVTSLLREGFILSDLTSLQIWHRFQDMVWNMFSDMETSSRRKECFVSYLGMEWLPTSHRNSMFFLESNQLTRFPLCDKGNSHFSWVVICRNDLIRHAQNPVCW